MKDFWTLIERVQNEYQSIETLARQLPTGCLVCVVTINNESAHSALTFIPECSIEDLTR